MFFLLFFCVSLCFGQLTNDILNGLFAGRSTAASAWKRAGSHGYYPVPLLSSGNEIPLIDGEYGDYSVVENKFYFVSGSIVGIAIEKVNSNWYLYATHNYSLTDLTYSPNVDTNDPFVGAYVSLFIYSDDWKIIGGKFLIKNKYSFSPGVIITQPFGGLSSIILIKNGFFGGSYLFMSESGNGGIHSWFVDVKLGNAYRIEACGSFFHTSTIPMSSYFPRNNHISKKTVIITSSSNHNGMGNIFMFVGDQTDNDRNGLKNGTLYILYAGYSYEQSLLNENVTVEWIPIPNDISTNTDPNILNSWITLNNKSTNFRNIAMISEDANVQGIFYISVLGGNYPIDSNLNLSPSECMNSTSILGGCDNPLGKIYKLQISTINPITELSSLKLVLEGSEINGAGFIDILSTQHGDIYIAEELTSVSLDEIFIAQNRSCEVRRINSNFNNTIEPFMKLDYRSLNADTPLFSEHMSHSSLIEVGDANNSVFLMCFQGIKINDTNIYSSQITIFIQLDVNQESDFGPPGSYESPHDWNPELVSSIIIGWALTVLMLVALFLGDTIRPVKAEESNIEENLEGEVILKEFDECMNYRENWCCGSRLGRNLLRVFTAGFLSFGGAVLAGFNPTIAGIIVGGAISGIGNGASTWLAWEKKEKHFVNVRLMNDFPRVANMVDELDDKLTYIIDTYDQKEKIDEIIKNIDVPNLLKEADITVQHRFYWVLRLGRNYARLLFAGGLSTAGGWIGGFFLSIPGIVGGALLGGIGNGISTWLAYEQPLDIITTKRALRDLPMLLNILKETDTRMSNIVDRLRFIKSDIQLNFP